MIAGSPWLPSLSLPQGYNYCDWASCTYALLSLGLKKKSAKDETSAANSQPEASIVNPGHQASPGPQLHKARGAAKAASGPSCYRTFWTWGPASILRERNILPKILKKKNHVSMLLMFYKAMLEITVLTTFLWKAFGGCVRSASPSLWELLGFESELADGPAFSHTRSAS